MNLKTLIKKLKIKLKIVESIEGNRDWGIPNNGFKLCLSCAGKSFTFPFYQGYGITHDPEVVEVVECLMSDSSVDEDYESFCQEFGYESDSNKAKKIHKACLRTRVKMQNLLGDNFESMLYADRN